MNCRKSKTLLFILIFFVLFTLTSCNDKKYKINVIDEKDIMMQVEDEYYVFFYKENCSYCDDVYEIINEYLINPKNLPLYVCLIKEDSIIYGKAEYGDGQGPDGKYYVDYVISYDRLRIAGVPSLIRVKFNGAIDECYYVTSGKENIIDYFNKFNNIDTFE